MKQKLGFLIWVLLLGINSCLSEKNILHVTSPESLKNVYECSILNRGVPTKLVGTVVYPKLNQKACQGFHKFNLSFISKPGGLLTILLVDRGDCYFKLKEWNAQNAGAAAILVADDLIEPLITMDTSQEDYTRKVTIPSAFITKTFGDSIKKSLSCGEMVNITLDWKRFQESTN